MKCHGHCREIKKEKAWRRTSTKPIKYMKNLPLFKQRDKWLGDLISPEDNTKSIWGTIGIREEIMKSAIVNTICILFPSFTSNSWFWSDMEATQNWTWKTFQMHFLRQLIRVSELTKNLQKIYALFQFSLFFPQTVFDCRGSYGLVFEGGHGARHGAVARFLL